jgi:hypothetical protein
VLRGDSGHRGDGYGDEHETDPEADDQEAGQQAGGIVRRARRGRQEQRASDGESKTGNGDVSGRGVLEQVAGDVGSDDPDQRQRKERQADVARLPTPQTKAYLTDVSVIVQFLIALVGLGLAIDYALLVMFRFRDELREGNDVESALVETMTHAGRSVIVSGSTVAIGLLALVALPLPLIRSMGIGGMLIPAVSVLASLTLLPALLAVLGTRINSVRVMPRRLIDRGHAEDGAWGRWARFVLRRPVAVAAVGLGLVAVLAGLGTQLKRARRS